MLPPSFPTVANIEHKTNEKGIGKKGGVKINIKGKSQKQHENKKQKKTENGSKQQNSIGPPIVDITVVCQYYAEFLFVVKNIRMYAAES